MTGPASEPSLSVELGSIALRNPVMPASGCFGPELAALTDFRSLGALVTKTIFYDARSGNPAPRLDETDAGMLNSVGIPSPGVEAFITTLLPRYAAWGTPVVVSIGGLRIAEYHRLADRLNSVPGIAAIEINVSCPNLEAGGLEIGTSPRQVEQVVRGVVDRAGMPVLVKLTPNVTSIGDIGRASEAAGATAVTAINTLLGYAIDERRGKPRIGNGLAGLSGPAIRPVALRAVSDLYRAVSIPIVGVGGICSTGDAVQFLLAGASAVQVGTATFTRPSAMARIVAGLTDWLTVQGFASVTDIVGRVPAR